MHPKKITVNDSIVIDKRYKTVFNQGFNSGIAHQLKRSKKARMIFKIKVILTAIVAVALTLLVVWMSK